jgi:hypothetical protein
MFYKQLTCIFQSKKKEKKKKQLAVAGYTSFDAMSA